jgi:hypothetical protein
MKKWWLTGLAFFALASAFTSCVSMEDRVITPEERERTAVVGTVSIEFTSFQFFDIPSKKSIKNKAYFELKKAAKEKYSGDIDIKNITISGSFSWWEILNLAIEIPLVMVTGILTGEAGYSAGEFAGGEHSGNVTTGITIGVGTAALIALAAGNTQKITAAGDVVLYNSITPHMIREVLGKASQTLIEKMPAKSTIAILSVSSSGQETSEFIVDELEYRLVNSGQFTIVDRRRLDQIRREQSFQLSGDVDDSSAISIGNLLGANIVITGSVSGTGTNQWLSLKALDVKTAQILAMAREQL